jgi:uncharacterized protein (DUF302 family)
LVTLGVFILSVALIGGTANVEAGSSGPKTEVFQTSLPFDDFLVRLKASIKANKMGIVAEACATCGAKKIGVTIPGNRVVMIFHPKFAVRMLKASLEAGVEAPLRLYVTEHPEGTRLSYHKASDVFAPYADQGDLDAMAKELDIIMARIANDATR